MVLDLEKSLGRGCGITCDNFFALLELTKELAKKQNSAWYYTRQIRKKIPRVMLPSKSRKVNSSLLLYSRDDNSMFHEKISLLYFCLVNITIIQLALHNMVNQIIFRITTNLRVPLIERTRC